MSHEPDVLNALGLNDMTASQEEMCDLSKVRTARQPHRCMALLLHRHERCARAILIGERYVEYFGETPGYQAGHRYCALCTPKNLGVTLKQIERFHAHQENK